ncbi:GNAT family N-acetyltransferase [Actinoalloteichus hymeniacidonis]|uniref:Acetyltransferase, ribosomal protein N-acetylase n=1 Tax=Actinoalloteichus hymeniacidonis TaxID=340345 RepID=A0AAC9HQN3_9PSEU|nr:GNAT family N-acetyltransferase [Actinoalloteichus hymeniacidonis]AOS63609.1 acetyltransferase, ribosomal protein N-acetylase [Actinoalloteichus hymeniacidonis]MBB5908343.1 RimJ/RimL family protein N-acetyltransferase [Actinoalloteichus hymeniacidonis]
MPEQRQRPRVHATSDRLILRDFLASDAAAVHAFASDPLVTQFTDWGPNTVADTREFMAGVVAQAANEPRVEFSLAAVHAGTDRLIGSVSIGITCVERRHGALGFVFHRDFWSQGYATEATALLLQFGFGSLRLQRVSATCHPGNVASARVLEKSGMRFTERLTSHLFVRGAWRDSLVFAAVRQDG